MMITVVMSKVELLIFLKNSCKKKQCMMLSDINFYSLVADLSCFKQRVKEHQGSNKVSRLYSTSYASIVKFLKEILPVWLNWW